MKYITVFIVLDKTWKDASQFTIDIKKVFKTMQKIDGWEDTILIQPILSLYILNESMYGGILNSLLKKISYKLTKNDIHIIHMVWCPSVLPELNSNESINHDVTNYIKELSLTQQQTKEFTYMNGINFYTWLAFVTNHDLDSLASKWATKLEMTQISLPNEKCYSKKIVKAIIDGLELTKRFDGSVIIDPTTVRGMEKKNSKIHKKMLCSITGFSIHTNMASLKRIKNDTLLSLQSNHKKPSFLSEKKIRGLLYLSQVVPTSILCNNNDLETVPLELRPTTVESKKILETLIKLQKEKVTLVFKLICYSNSIKIKRDRSNDDSSPVNSRDKNLNRIFYLFTLSLNIVKIGILGDINLICLKKMNLDNTLYDIRASLLCNLDQEQIQIKQSEYNQVNYIFKQTRTKFKDLVGTIPTILLKSVLNYFTEVQKVIQEDTMGTKYINDNLVNSKILKEANIFVKNITKLAKEETKDIEDLTKIKFDHLLKQNILHELLIETNSSQVVNKIANPFWPSNIIQSFYKSNLKKKRV